MRGFDLVATNPDTNRYAKIQVKSRWKVKAEGFIIKNFDCDFIVIALLNRGSKDGSKSAKAPEYYVLPVEAVRNAPRSKGWGKVSFTQIPNFAQYCEHWELIRDFLTKQA